MALTKGQARNAAITKGRGTVRTTVARTPVSALHKGTPGQFQTEPRPVIHKGTPGQFQTEPRPVNATVPPSAAPQSTSGGAPPVQPFLTPLQQKALNDWNTKYAGDLSALDFKDSNALTEETGKIQGLEQTNVQDVSNTNQSAAARGIFQSSIRDGALNDLAATLAMNENVARTNYQTTLFNDSIDRQTLRGQNNDWQTYYNDIAVNNAQGVPPDTTQTPNQPAATNPAATPHPETSVLTKGTPGQFQTEARPAGAMPQSLPHPTIQKGLGQVGAPGSVLGPTFSKGQAGVRAPGLTAVAAKGAAGIRLRG